MALAALDERTTVHVASLGARLEVHMESIEVTLENLLAMVAPRAAVVSVDAERTATADPLDELYARLAFEYRRHPATRSRSGGLPGELIKL